VGGVGEVIAEKKEEVEGVRVWVVSVEAGMKEGRGGKGGNESDDKGVVKGRADEDESTFTPLSKSSGFVLNSNAIDEEFAVEDGVEDEVNKDEEGKEEKGESSALDNSMTALPVLPVPVLLSALVK